MLDDFNKYSTDMRDSAFVSVFVHIMIFQIFKHKKNLDVQFNRILEEWCSENRILLVLEITYLSLKKKERLLVTFENVKEEVNDLHIGQIFWLCIRPNVRFV